MSDSHVPNEIQVAAKETREAIVSRDVHFLVNIGTAGDYLTEYCHGAAYAAGWWHDPVTGEYKERNTGECIALMHSELSEALEAARKNLMDDHLPHRKGIECEFADTIIRIFDYAGAHGLDLGSAIAEKLAYNASRADHRLENRAKEGGKAF